MKNGRSVHTIHLFPALLVPSRLNGRGNLGLSAGFSKQGQGDWESRNHFLGLEEA